MRVTPRRLAALAVAGAFGTALAPWWTLSWAGPVGSGAAEVAGGAGTGGLAQVLAVAAAGGLLLTLTLGAAGRRVIGILLGALSAGMVAVGVSAFSTDAATLAAAVPTAMLATDAIAHPTFWPGIHAALALVGVAASAWLVARPEAGRRRPDRDAPAAEVADSQASWEAMDEGRDPTRDAGDEEPT